MAWTLRSSTGTCHMLGFLNQKCIKETKGDNNSFSFKGMFERTLRNSLRSFLLYHRQVRSLSSHVTKTPNLKWGISYSNKILSEHAKGGDLETAKEVFDKMSHRDVVSWNSMMSAYIHNGRYELVLQTFVGMQHHGIRPAQTTFSIALSSCARLETLVHGKLLHGLFIKSSSSANEFVGTSLITMYSQCYAVDSLEKVFDEFEHQNVASWNALISGFVYNGYVERAHNIFNRMPRRNVVSWTAMISAYMDIGRVNCALGLFTVMPVEKNSVTWSVVLGGLVLDGQYDQALGWFLKMLASGTQVSVSCVLKVVIACSGLKSLRTCQAVHGYVIKLGLDLDSSIEASLVAMYFKVLKDEEAMTEFLKMNVMSIGSWNCLIAVYIDNDKVDEARWWFDKMRERDKISWNLMINGYLRDERINEALTLFSSMPEPTVETYTAMISGFIENDNIDDAQNFFNMMPERDVIAYTTMIFGYMEEGSLEDGLNLFDKMPIKNVVAYNIIISGLARHGKVKQAIVVFDKCPLKDAISWNFLIVGFIQSGFHDEAFLLFQRMTLSGMRPNDSTLASLLSVSAKLSALRSGEMFHGATIRYGHEPSLVVANSLINMYAKCGDMSAVKYIFDGMEKLDLVTWNSIIHGYAINGFGMESIAVFEKMRFSETKPDDITFLGVLSACMHNNLLEKAEHYFDLMKYDYGLMPGLSHYACLIDLLCRNNLLQKAETIIASLPFEPDPVIWTSVLTGCKTNCNIRLAEHAANKLFILIPGDPMPYIHLCEIYQSSGRWAELKDMKHQMNILGFNKRPGCSWVDMIS